MIKDVDVTARSLGVTIKKGGEAEVVVWAPLLEKVELLLVDQQKKLPLQKEALGYWSVTTNEIKNGDQYKLVLNGEKERPDPASLAQPEGVHGPSAVVDVNTFAWTDNDWKNIPLQDYILYELHTGTFTPEGTFAGIESRLDYLKSLGINAIEIMPVAQFPGSRNWGYDGVFPFAVQHSYGGAEGLQHLVDACHQKGIAVVLDVVYNHMGPEGNYLSEYGPYFTDKYNTPWGNAINFDDAWCDGVRRYFIENVLMWFRDFHIDALRMDAVHAIKDFSAKHILREIKEEVNKLMEKTGRQHYLIVELDLNDTRFINSLEKEGFGMDAQWVDEFHHALRVTAGGDRNGYYADFEGIHHLAKAYKDAYVYDGQYSEHRKKKFGIKAATNPGQQFIVFSQNHDQVGNRMLGERTSELHSFEMQKLLAGAVLVSPYLPMLFMGEEWSETNRFQYFVSHTDPDLAEAVRKGRKAEFAAFHAEGEAPDPVSEATFNASKLQWHLLEMEPHKTMFRFYQTCIQLRRQLFPLQQMNRNNIDVAVHQKEQTLVVHRWSNGQHVVCTMNFSKEAQAIVLPAYANRWYKKLDSAAPEWKGKSAAPDVVNADENLKLQAESILIYSNR